MSKYLIILDESCKSTSTIRRRGAVMTPLMSLQSHVSGAHRSTHSAQRYRPSESDRSGRALNVGSSIECERCTKLGNGGCALEVRHLAPAANGLVVPSDIGAVGTRYGSEPADLLPLLTPRSMTSHACSSCITGTRLRIRPRSSGCGARDSGQSPVLSNCLGDKR